MSYIQTPEKWFSDSPRPPEGMLVSVRLLRDRGKKLSPAQVAAAPALVGCLRVEEICAHSGRGRGFRSEAVLARPGGQLGSVRQPLFDPVLVRFDARGWILRGCEISTVDGETAQFVQAWHITPHQDENAVGAGAPAR